MTITGYQDTLTELSFAQLMDALSAANNEYDARWNAFLGACKAGVTAIENHDAEAEAEARAEMDAADAARKEQGAMCRAISAEITARIGRHDYA